MTKEYLERELKKYRAKDFEKVHDLDYWEIIEKEISFLYRFSEIKKFRAFTNDDIGEFLKWYEVEKNLDKIWRDIVITFKSLAYEKEKD